MKEKYQYKEIISKKDIEKAFRIYQTNKEYFKVVSNKSPDIQDVINDKNALPEGASWEDMHYGLYGLNDEVIGVTHLIEKFPDKDAVYIGLFMINGNYHCKGYGRNLMQQLEEEIKQKGYQRIRLGVVEENRKAMKFWLSLGFKDIKTVKSTIKPETNWMIHVMEKSIM